jgi:hydroxymethylpyrimidine pyrophosphatase-like HAD family hydrolase
LLAELAATLRIDPPEIEAFGDSRGDVPMLRSVGTSVYVGRALPEGFRPTWHAPDTDLDVIVGRLLTA